MSRSPIGLRLGEDNCEAEGGINYLGLNDLIFVVCCLFIHGIMFVCFASSSSVCVLLDWSPDVSNAECALLIFIQRLMRDARGRLLLWSGCQYMVSMRFMRVCGGE